MIVQSYCLGCLIHQSFKKFGLICAQILNMKGDKRRIKSSFKVGSSPHNKGYKLEEPSITPANVVPFQRLTVSEAEDVFNHAFSVSPRSPNASRAADHEDLRLLRSKEDVPLEVNQKAETPYIYR